MLVDIPCIKYINYDISNKNVGGGVECRNFACGQT